MKWLNYKSNKVCKRKFNMFYILLFIMRVVRLDNKRVKINASCDYVKNLTDYIIRL